MATFNIYIDRTGKSEAITGVIVGAFGVHHQTVHGPDDAIVYTARWNVSHLPTGKKIVTFTKRNDALRFAKMLDQPVWSSRFWRFGADPKRLKRAEYYRAAYEYARKALEQFGRTEFS